MLARIDHDVGDHDFLTPRTALSSRWVRDVIEIRVRTHDCLDKRHVSGT